MKKYLLCMATMLVCSLTFAGCGNKDAIPQDNTVKVQESEEASTEFTYEKKEDSLCLTAYNGTEEILHLPSQLDGMPVTEIGESCFAGNIHLKKVYVPEGITSIGDYAFECCGVLEKAYLPESLISLGRGAFSGCGCLTLADLQDGVEEIGDGAFLACYNLPVFYAPSSLKTLGQFAFACCKSMYLADFGTCQITEIPDRALYKNYLLQRVILPETVTSIGKRSFSDCSALNYIYLPETVKNLEPYAFERCEKLTSIDIQGGEVKANAFSGCHALNYVNFVSADTILREAAFNNTGVDAEQLYLPEGITIEEGAFPPREEHAYAEDESDDGVFEEEEITPPEWDDIKTIDQIFEAAKDAGYKVVTNEEYDSWSDEYLAYNEETGLFDRDKNIFTDMYKIPIEDYFEAMTAAATKDPGDMETAYMRHGDDFIPMYEMANHGLLTEMKRLRMKDDLFLLTGVYDSQLKNAAGTSYVPDMQELKEKIGTSFQDSCLTSTTNDVSVAAHFSDTMFLIYAPAESVNALGAISMDAFMRTHEHETLLFSGAEYEILDVGYFSFQNENETTGEEETQYEKYVLLQLINQ